MASSSADGARRPKGRPAGIVDRVNRSLRRIPSWPLYLLGAMPPAWLLWAGITGGLGVDPVRVMEHEMGLWSLWLLIATLAVTPLRRYAGINLIKFRRAFGLLAFFYVLGHLLVWLVFDVQLIPGLIWEDLIKRPYITMGMAAFLLLIPLAVTSNNWSIRRLGVRWRLLHQFVYFVAILGAVHFIMVRKGLQFEPLIYLGVILALVATRIRLPRR